MGGSPYREPGRPDEPGAPPPAPVGDADLVGAFGLFWIASIARVAGAIVRHEGFGTEATLALLCIPLLPYMLRGTLAGALRRRIRTP